MTICHTLDVKTFRFVLTDADYDWISRTPIRVIHPVDVVDPLVPGKGRAKVHECDDGQVNVVFVHTLALGSVDINLRCRCESRRIRGSDASRKTMYGVITRFLGIKEDYLVTLSGVDGVVEAPGFVAVMGCGIAVEIATMDKNCSH